MLMLSLLFDSSIVAGRRDGDFPGPLTPHPPPSERAGIPAKRFVLMPSGRRLQSGKSSHLQDFYDLLHATALRAVVFSRTRRPTFLSPYPSFLGIASVFLGGY